MSEIIKQINDVAAFVSEQDLDEWIVPKLLEHYDLKIRSLASKAYGPSAHYTNDGPTLAMMAFRERAKAELYGAMKTFIFKSEHWRTGRDVNTYLLKSLNRLADRTKWDTESAKKINLLVCPGCKFLLKREFLEPFGDFWKCPECSDELRRVDNEIKTYSETEGEAFIMRLESKARLYRAFAIHSRRGYRCSDCCRFIPESCNGEHGIGCPYPDCDFFGKIECLERMAHPVGLTKQMNLSLQTSIDDGGDGPDIQEAFAADVVDPDIHMEVHENFEEEIVILKEVIAQQLQAVKRTNAAGTMLQKVLMYEAYSNMLDKYPEEMVSYLVHKKQSADFPLQARIFQEYVGLMQDALPYTIKKNGEDYEVVSLLDPKISLFEGISEFDAVVKNDYTIPNNTRESYMGGRKFKNYGPCFIGLIIDVKDRRNNESIRHHVREYSFVQIKMKKTVSPGTPVVVRHYRMASHYEMGSLVYLQRIRKRIVNSVELKMRKRELVMN